VTGQFYFLVNTLVAYTHDTDLFFYWSTLAPIWTLPRYLKPKVCACTYTSVFCLWNWRLFQWHRITVAYVAQTTAATQVLSLMQCSSSTNTNIIYHFIPQTAEAVIQWKVCNVWIHNTITFCKQTTSV